MGDILVDIILSSIDIVKYVREFYIKVEKRTDNMKLKDFWHSQTSIKECQMGYLHKVLVYAKQGVIPQVFSRPFEIQGELSKTKKDLESFFDESLKKGSKEDLFTAAYFATI